MIPILLDYIHNTSKMINVPNNERIADRCPLNDYYMAMIDFHFDINNYINYAPRAC